MPLTNNLVYRFTRLTLLVGGVTSFFGAVLVMIYLVTGNMPQVLNRQSFLDVKEWENGIPASAKAVDAKIPGTFILPGQNTEMNTNKMNQPGKDSTYTNRFMVTYVSEPASVGTIHSARVTEVKAFIIPGNWKLRIYLLLPVLLNLLLFSFAAWQLSNLLHSIMKGNAFRNHNHVTLRRIAWAFLIVQGLFLIMHLTAPGFITQVMISGDDQIHRQKAFQFFLESPFNLPWMIAACILLIFSMAWKGGMKMQVEQDHTL